MFQCWFKKRKHWCAVVRVKFFFKSHSNALKNEQIFLLKKRYLGFLNTGADDFVYINLSCTFVKFINYKYLS
jgi:hypothetical protein